MKCSKHGVEMRMIRCPDGRRGCLVAHFACSKCEVEYKERQTLEALQEANGLRPPQAKDQG